MKKANRYERIIEMVFFSHYRSGDKRVSFTREELLHAAQEAKIKVPKNIGDLVYSFRYRYELPETIKKKAPVGLSWIIRPSGRSLYAFVAVSEPHIEPNPALMETRIPDSTPGIISMYALNDEQALLAKLRYNRLIDIFTGVTCYSLQNHLRTFVDEVGQIETDELYVGVDKRGAQYVFPIQAKGSRDKINVVQIEQDIAMCSQKFPALICRPIAAQFTSDNLIALFDMQQGRDGLRIASEKHYMLVDPSQLTAEELRGYAAQTLE
ncbi:MAG: endonuclease [Spirochaetia bacterium]|jgi:hypothetical protein